MIRRSAQQGDWLFGFAAKRLHPDNRLIYIARVTERLDNGSYYASSAYGDRPDCMYKKVNSVFTVRPGTWSHTAANLEHDLGRPPQYDRAVVSVSDDFRYFGGAPSIDYKTRFPQIKRLIEKLGQGHRVKHPRPVENELLQLREEIWRTFPTKMDLAPSPKSRPYGVAPTCSNSTIAPKRSC
jgi:hypothetical protein